MILLRVSDVAVMSWRFSWDWVIQGYLIHMSGCWYLQFPESCFLCYLSFLSMCYFIIQYSLAQVFSYDHEGVPRNSPIGFAWK